MYKICSNCGLEKDLSEFYPSKISKDGLTYVCKECKSNYNRNYVLLNKAKLNLYNKNANKSEKVKKSKLRYAESDHGKLVLMLSSRNYYKTEKGMINMLKKRIKSAKTEKTRIKLLNMLKELEKRIADNT